MAVSTNQCIESVLTIPSKSHSNGNITVFINYSAGPVKSINLKLDGETNGGGSVYLYSKEQVKEPESIRNSDLQSKINSYLKEKKDLIVINLKPGVTYLDVDSESRLVADVIANYLETQKKYTEAQKGIWGESSPLMQFPHALDEESVALFYRFLPMSLGDEVTGERLFGWVVLPRE